MEEKYNRMVTIDDIARIAGVGRGTVDRVIHNRGRVSKDTYDKVVKVIKELDYKPNIAARMLGKRKDLKIAVIYHNYESDFWNQVESGIAKAESEYAPMGIRIDRFVLEKINQKKQEEVLSSVIKDKYDGVAIVPYKSSEVVKLINELVEKNVPVIAFNNDEPCNRTAYVGQDLYKSGRTAGKLMAMMAKPNTVFAELAVIYSGMSALNSRLTGFQDVINEERKDMIRYGTFSFREDNSFVYSLTQSLIQSGNIDAIYVSNVMVETVAEAIKDSGYKNKILLVGHDITPKIVRYLKEGIIDVTIGQEPEKQGYIAVEKLCRKLLMDEDISGDTYTKIEVVVKENIP